MITVFLKIVVNTINMNQTDIKKSVDVQISLTINKII